jgi:hypothetical protein
LSDESSARAAGAERTIVAAMAVATVRSRHSGFAIMTDAESNGQATRERGARAASGLPAVLPRGHMSA